MKTPALISAISLAASGLSFLGQLAVAWRFGPTASVDVYFIALSLPLFFGGIANAAIGYRAIPVLIQNASSLKPSASPKQEDVLLGWAVLGAVFIALAGSILSTILLPRYPNGSTIVAHAGIHISWIAWSTTAIGLVSAVLSAVCHLNGRFLLPVFVTWFPSVGLLTAWLLALPALVHFALALLLGQLLAALSLGIVLVHANGLRISFQSPRVFLRELRETPLIVISVLSFTAFGAVDAITASSLPEGTITVLAYAQRITIAIGGFAVNGIAAVTFPQFARLFSDNSFEALGVAVIRTTRIVAVIVAPVILLLSAWSGFILPLLFRTSTGATTLTAPMESILPGYLLGGLLMSCSTILLRGLYASRLVRYAALLSATGFSLYAGLSFLLLYTGRGLLAFPIAYVGCWTAFSIGAIAVLHRELRLTDTMPYRRGLLGHLTACGIAWIAAWLAARFIRHWLPIHSTDFSLGSLALLIPFAAAIIFIYASILHFFRMDEVAPLTEFLQRFRKKT